MKIGIAIDDTTFNTINSMIKYADIYDAKMHGNKKKENSFGYIKNRYYLSETYDWDEKTKFDFFEKYYKNVLEECVMLPNANSIIKKLKDEGNEIHFVTARLMIIENCDSKKITIDSLKRYNIPYDSLNMQISDKLDFFKKNNLDICIEDSFETCKQFEENGIKSVLMTSKMNERIDSGTITRVNSWNELYEEIQKYKHEIGIENKI